tara:strand:- start:1382 stop:1906 length:525 start_codon:yes stop_codon:yes gene_type:complete
MARTLTVRKGNGANPYSEGWHRVTISSAKYGEWNGSKFLDVCFEGYSEKCNMRVYEKMGKDGEEFAIGQVFRFADAGITDGLEDADGNVTIKMDDSPDTLVGKEVNIFLYKDGEYSRVLSQVAPVTFKNIIEEFTDSDVDFWKGKADTYYTKYIQPKLSNTTTETNDVTADMPF